MIQESSIKFLFPKENDHFVQVERSLLERFSKSKWEEEEKIEHFPSHYLHLTIAHLKNPEKDLNYEEADKVYECAKYLNLNALKEKIVQYVEGKFKKKKYLQQQLSFSETESRKNLYSRALQLYDQKNNTEWTVLNLFSPVTSSVNFLWSSTYGVVRGIYKLFCDGKHDWKDFRYATILSQHVKSYGLKNLQEEKDLSLLVAPLISYEGTSRERYKQFIKLFREFYLKEEHKEQLQKMAVQHFTEITCLPFLTQLCLFLALKQNPCFLEKIMDSKNLTFSEKCKALKEAIDNVDSSFTKPISHTVYNKMEKLLPNFDSLAKSNMPWKFLEATFYHKEKGKHEVIFIRSGVPINDEGVVVEFRAFIEGLVKTNKKLAVFIHLNPKFFDKSTLTAEDVVNDFQKLPRKESKWIEAMGELEKIFPENIEVFVLPFDGKWIKQLEKDEGTTLEQLKSSVIEEMKQPKSSFLLSHSVRQEFLFELDIEVLLDQVASQHYYYKAKEEPLSKEEKMAYLALFYHDLIHYYTLKLGVNVVMNHCTDGRDRTGIQLMTFAAKLHDLNHLKNEEAYQIIGTGMGPAVALAKESPHPHRWPYMLAVLRQLEKAPAKDLLCRGSGWRVDHFLLPEDHDQTLVPGPSYAPSLEEYQFRLKEEKEFPFVLPKKLALKCLKSEKSSILEEDLIKQCDLDLARQRIFFGTQELEIVGVEHFEKWFLEYSCLIEKKEVRSQILFFLSQTSIAESLILLKKRYDNSKVGVELLSGNMKEGAKQDTNIELEGENLKITLTRTFPLCLVDNRNILGFIEMQMTVLFDKENGASLPIMGWKVI